MRMLNGRDCADDQRSSQVLKSGFDLQLRAVTDGYIPRMQTTLSFELHLCDCSVGVPSLP